MARGSSYRGPNGPETEGAERARGRLPVVSRIVGTRLPTACALVLLVVAAGAQTPGKEPPAGAASAAPAKGARPTVRMPPLLRPMFVDKSLFKPDKWWEYEEPEEERPRAYSVEQEGKVEIGGRLSQNRGCIVRYRVAMCETPGKAHALFQALLPKPPVPVSVRRSLRTLRYGDEGEEITSRLIGEKGVTLEFGRESVVRFGRYVVTVYSRSDMKAFGPAPASGERRWMADAVYDAVVRAVMSRWARYPSLLAGVK
jgi:hypothetical protein